MLFFEFKPATSWLTEDGTVVQHGIDMIKRFVAQGYVPVIHGDAVLDLRKSTDILSGDTIAVVSRSNLGISVSFINTLCILKELCKEIRPKKVIFVSDAVGPFTKPPTEDGVTVK